MRIRKRSQSVAPVTLPPQLPISCKYQQAPGLLMRPEYSRAAEVVPECSNMQEPCRLDALKDHDSPQSSSDGAAPVTESLRLSDAHGGDLSEHKPTDTERRRKQAPSKRRKVEHESSLLFEGSSSMTAAEVLAVNELANGVRQRLAASEQSTSEQATKALVVKPSENSKDALISSIFYAFDTCGENGLSASEVVKYMLEQRLPGLKEGGARHTVQVANVLRSSTSFISLGDKKYLLCSALDSKHRKPSTTRHQAPASPNSSEETNLAQTLNPKPRRGKPQFNTRSNKKVQAEKPIAQAQPEEEEEEEDARQGSDGEAAEPVVRIARRRGPSSSQKGKGPTQCKRYDGRGWQCSRLTEPGYSLCVHHQDLINKRAAKLKEQQTLTRLMESVHRKTKTLPPPPNPKPSEPEPPLKPSEPGNLKLKIVLSNKDRDENHKEKDLTIPDAPVQKRKMLSLLAIK